MDCFPRFIEMSYLRDGSKAKDVIIHTKSIFARYDIPQYLISDNGPPFSSRDFRQFFQSYGFNLVMKPSMAS